MRNGQSSIVVSNGIKCEYMKEAAVFKIPREKYRFEAKVAQVSEQKTVARNKLRLYNASITLKKRT